MTGALHLGTIACLSLGAALHRAIADATPCCPADLSGDLVVNGDDLGTLLGAWGRCVGCPEDLNADGMVDGDDLGALLGLWGSCSGEADWQRTFGQRPGVNFVVRALVVFDDGLGGGPALYAGGSFTGAGGVEASRIAKWDGTAWSPLGSGVNGTVYALAVFDDGLGAGPALYAGGDFTMAGGASAKRIAKWDGAAWSALGGGSSGTVFSLAVFDDGGAMGPVLCAGRAIGTGGAVGAWNGRSWSTLGSGMNGWIRALTAFDDGAGGGPALYAGGDFTTAGGTNADRIAKWNGREWSAVGGGVDNAVHALAVFDDGSGAGPALQVGGWFTQAGGMAASRIARWNGRAWSPLGSGTNELIRALAVFDDGSGAGPALHAAGDFTIAGGNTANRIARWDGTAWSPLGSGISDAVRALAAFDLDSGAGPALCAAGLFTSAGDVVTGNIASWSSGAWSPVGRGLSDHVLALALFDGGSRGAPRLHAGGRFSTAGSEAANFVARWDGSEWSTLGSGMNGFVRALIVFDDGSGSGPALYAGGDFTAAGGVPANHIAKWDGAAWSPIGDGLDGPVWCLAIFDDGGGPELVAGGAFSTAGGAPANRIAKWNGRRWSSLGSGMSDAVSALAVFDDGTGRGAALVAGGYFTVAGGENANLIAKWDGVAWSPLGNGMDDSVHALLVHDDGSGAALYAGGYFTAAGEVAANRVARWNGREWSSLGSGMDREVLAFTLFDDGSGTGPALIAGGDFTTAGGTPAVRTARWNGVAWSPFASGVDGAVLAFTVLPGDPWSAPALCTGGEFVASPAGDSYIAKWGCGAARR